MAKFTSKYPSYGFYTNGELKRFSNGIYVTEDKDEIITLSGLRDVEIVVETQQNETTEAKPTPKAPAKRTASAK